MKRSRIAALMTVSACVVGLSNAAMSQNSNSFDGTYTGPANGLAPGCLSKPNETVVIKNNILEISTRNNGIALHNTIPISQNGQFSGNVGSGQFSGSIKSGALTGDWIVEACVFRFDLKKQ